MFLFKRYFFIVFFLVFCGATYPYKKAKFLPFYTMLKWGLTPIEAYKLSLSKDICKSSARVKEILKKKKWHCWKDL